MCQSCSTTSFQTICYSDSIFWEGLSVPDLFGALSQILTKNPQRRY